LILILQAGCKSYGAKGGSLFKLAVGESLAQIAALSRWFICTWLKGSCWPFFISKVACKVKKSYKLSALSSDTAELTRHKQQMLV
jgi:hypothetical protein